MSSPLPTAALCFTYVYFVKVWGPKFMENRPAHNLQVIVAIYNIFQILANGWLFYELSRFGWFGNNDYSFVCQPVDYSGNEGPLRMLRAGYLFFLLKIVDFVDTFIFVLRKKNNQISNLHVIHHAVMPISSWPGVRYVAGGHSLFFALLNTLVHVVMYLYYFLAGLGPRYKKYLWWKQYLTTFQIAQFVIAIIHSFLPYFSSKCDYPFGFCLWISGNELLMLVMFTGFYREHYITKKKV